MLRFKQFFGTGPDLEQAVNDWLDTFEPEVSQMVQTTDGKGTVVLGFLFEESFRGQERRMSAESTARSAVETALRPGDIVDRPLEIRAGPD